MYQVLNNGVWQGSTVTAQLVAQEIEAKFGKEANKAYDPMTNCLTYQTWKRKGYQVKKGEHGIRSITYIRKAEIDDKTGKLTGKTVSYPKNVTLFWKDQVMPIA